MGKQKVDVNFIKDSFSGAETVELYKEAVIEVGLWKSEKIVFQKFLQPTDHILDIGCGAGRTTFGLYNLGFHCIEGLDLSEKMILEARRHDLGDQIPFHVGNATNLNFEDESFGGVIFSFNGLMQIPKKENRQKALQEINRILEVGGYFIFTTHDRMDSMYLSYWNEEAKRWQKGQQNPRLHEFGDMIIKNDHRELFLHFPTKKEVIQLIHSTGFKLVESQLRSEICEEPEMDETFSTNCIFWVIAKL